MELLSNFMEFDTTRDTRCVQVIDSSSLSIDDAVPVPGTVL